MLNYNHALYFHHVATEGSITRGAEKLQLSPATVSEQIRQFERALGIDLFERTSSGLRLTGAGRRVLAQTTLMFQAAERLAAEVSGEPDTEHVLDVGISVSASRSLASDLLTPLLSIETVRPTIRTGQSSELVDKLRNGQLDLVISEESPKVEWLEATEVHRPKLVAIASPQAASGGSWKNQHMVSYLPESPLRHEVEVWARKNVDEMRLAAVTDDCHFMIEVVARGTAFAVVPRSVARDAIERKRVVVVGALPQTQIAVYALARSKVALPLVTDLVQRLVKYAKDSFDPEPR